MAAMQGVTPQAQTRQAVRKTTVSELTPSSLICTLRPCHGRHSRGLAQRPTIRTRLFVGILRLVLGAAVEIRGADYCYRALVGSGLIEQLGTCVRKALGGKRCAVVTDNIISPLFANRVQRSLTSAGFPPPLCQNHTTQKNKT